MPDTIDRNPTDAADAFAADRVIPPSVPPTYQLLKKSPLALLVAGSIIGAGAMFVGTNTDRLDTSSQLAPTPTRQPADPNAFVPTPTPTKVPLNTINQESRYTIQFPETWSAVGDPSLETAKVLRLMPIAIATQSGAPSMYMDITLEPYAGSLDDIIQSRQQELVSQSQDAEGRSVIYNIAHVQNPKGLALAKKIPQLISFENSAGVITQEFYSIYSDHLAKVVIYNPGEYEAEAQQLMRKIFLRLPPEAVSTDGWTSYTHPTASYSLQYPADRMVEEDIIKQETSYLKGDPPVATSNLFYTTPPTDPMIMEHHPGMLVTVTLVDNPDGLSLEQWLDTYWRSSDVPHIETTIRGKRALMVDTTGAYTDRYVAFVRGSQIAIVQYYLDDPISHTIYQTLKI